MYVPQVDETKDLKILQNLSEKQGLNRTASLLSPGPIWWRHYGRSRRWSVFVAEAVKNRLLHSLSTLC